MIRSAAAVLALAVWLPHAAHAALRTWTGAGNGYKWTDPANWDGNTLPVNGDALYFPPGSVTGVMYDDLGTLTSVDRLWIDDTYRNDAGFGFTLQNGLSVAPWANTQWVAPFLVGQSQTWSGGNTGLSQFRAEMTSAAATLTLAPAGTWQIAIGGTGTIEQTSGVVKVWVYPNGCSAVVPTLRTTGGELIVETSEQEPPIPVEVDGATARLTFDRYGTARSIHAVAGTVVPRRPEAQFRFTAVAGALTLGAGAQYEVLVTPVVARAPTNSFWGLGTRVFRSPLHVGWPGSSEYCAVGPGTVELNDAALEVVPLDRVAGCTTLVIIDNDGTDPVVGTFAGLPEGATFTTASGQTFRISYVGGSGNDVTITAVDGLAHCSLVDTDFHGQRASSILWRRTTTGENAYWYRDPFMTPDRFVRNALPQVPDTNWKLIDAVDFDGDGRSDFLWRHAATGENFLWRMSGGTVLESGYINTVPDLNWEIAGTGDFNGDGKADILWRHRITGENYLYLMDGRTIVAAGALWTIADTDWTIEGTGDLNADGYADIVWRHGGTGEVYGWLMNGFAVASSGVINYVPDPNWTINSIADFDADRQDDILWRNTATGEVYLYLMDGTTIRQAGTLTTISDLGWDIAATGDYDADGRNDLFWRHTSGLHSLYIMNGFSFWIRPEDPLDNTWQVIP